MKPYLTHGPFEVALDRMPEEGEYFTYILYAERDPETNKIPIYVGRVETRRINARLDYAHPFTTPRDYDYCVLATFEGDQEEKWHWHYKNDPEYQLESTHSSDRTAKPKRKGLKVRQSEHASNRERIARTIERIKVLKSMGFTAAHPAAVWWQKRMGPGHHLAFAKYWNRPEAQPLIIDKPIKRIQCKACNFYYDGEVSTSPLVDSRIIELGKQMKILTEKVDILLFENGLCKK